MTGVDQSLKGTEPEFSVVSSSCYSTISSNYGSPCVFISDVDNLGEFMPNPEDGRIPSTAFEPAFPTNDWSMVTATPRYEATSDMFSHNFDAIYSNSTEKLMTSPSIQPMDISAGYDPERIPSTIFSSKTAGQCEWSLPSNESLFSIPNYSFSRNQAILLQKSEEVGLIGEFNSTYSTNPFLSFESKANEANNFSPNLRPVIETDTEHERGHSLDIKDNDKEIIEEPSKQVEGMTSKQTEHSQKHVQSLEDVSTSVRSGCITGVERNSNCSSTTRVSAESQSSHSFAFPVLLNEVEKSSSLAKPQINTVKATSRNSEKKWFSFSCFRIWHRCWTCCP